MNPSTPFTCRFCLKALKYQPEIPGRAEIISRKVNMYKTIMVPLDGSELAECVLPHVESIARGCGGEVLLVRVVEPLHMHEGLEKDIILEERKRLEAESMEVARSYLERIAVQLENSGISVKSEVLSGKVADELIDYANGKDVGLVIIASHGRSGISRWVWGSVAERILHGVCIPVMIVRAPGCVIGVKTATRSS